MILFRLFWSSLNTCCCFFKFPEAIIIWDITAVFFFLISFLRSCLNAIRILQKNGHVPSDSAVFKSYAEYGHFVDIRIAALEAVVDYTKGREDDMALCVCVCVF